MPELKHYGIKMKSGRYPWGSGDTPHQRGASFLSYVEDLKKKGMSDVEIAEGLGLKTTMLRSIRTMANDEVKLDLARRAMNLKEKGYSTSEIGRLMGKNESSIRGLLAPGLKAKAEVTEATANFLKENLEKKEFLDVGLGTENHLGISRAKLKTSIELLKEEGYNVYYVKQEQAGTGKSTNIMVLAKPGATFPEVLANKHNIRAITEFNSKDGGLTYDAPDPIKNISSKRILIKYDEEGGSDKDGVVELRRNVEDLNMGKANYAQVRIGVDGKHYLKGMAMYSDEVPDGVDIIYNTNKKKGTPPEKVFKVMSPDMNDPKAKAIQKMKLTDSEKSVLLEEGVRNGSIKPDPSNPFGAAIKKGGQKGALNIISEEGDWSDWSGTLSSQFLAKQSKGLIQKQLDLAYKGKVEELEVIKSLTNPVIKKSLLTSFADDVDASAVHLKAAALPRQGWHAILPFSKMKETEVYAPNYKDGEQVVLIRYPHGGIFEIPQLTVNNRQAAVKKVLGKQTKDAIGIHPKVAGQLSGADFDGDTVLVIPTNGKMIKTESYFKDLKDFNPKKYQDLSLPKMSPKTKGVKMGDISNLITDMTIKGANNEEIIRAVKHSMVVIDAEKHSLNYKKSYDEHSIGALKKKYQGSEKAGASTLISKASSQKRVPYRKEYYKIDPKTGEKVYEYVPETYTNKKGKTVSKTVKTTWMAEVKDARELSSGTIKEELYADYANKLKALGNSTRKEVLATPNMKYNPSANKAYAKEVSSLKAQLNTALKNAPLERQAQLLADKIVKAKKEANPNMEHSKLQKIKGQAITEARIRTGANKQRITLTPREWEAIQAGAVTSNVLSSIIKNTDMDHVKQLAMPRESTKLSPAKIAKAKAMATSGYTQSEIAESIGVSTNVIAKTLD